MIEQFAQDLDEILAETHALISECQKRLAESRTSKDKFDFIFFLKEIQRLYNYYQVLSTELRTSEPTKKLISQALVVRGLAKQSLDNYEGAQSDYQTAVETDPLNENGYIGLAGCNSKGENLEAALFELTKAVELNPMSGAAWYDFGHYYNEQKDYQQARTCFEKALELDQSAYYYNYSCGLACYTLDDFQQAIVYFSKSLEFFPEHAEAYCYRGSCYQQLKRNPEALVNFERALEIEPNNYLALYFRGCFYYHSQQNEWALADFDRAIAINSLVGGLYDYRGLAYYRLKQYKRAIADLERAHRLDPEKATKIVYHFGDIKPVKTRIIIFFLVACLAIYVCTALLSTTLSLSFIILINVLGWPILVGLIFLSLGKLKLKDIGLNRKQLFQGIAFTLGTWVLLQVAELLIAFKDNNVRVNPELGQYFDYRSFNTFIVYTLADTALKVVLFQGFLFTQIYLKLKGPWRGANAIIFSQIYYLLVVFFAITLQGGANFYSPFDFFWLFLNCILISVLYIYSQNLYLCIGFYWTLLEAPHLFNTGSNSAIFIYLIWLIVIRKVPNYYQLRGEYVIFEDLVDRDPSDGLGKLVETVYPRFLTFAGVVIGTVIVAGLNIIDKILDVNIFSTIILLVFIAAFLVVAWPEISRFRKKEKDEKSPLG